LPRVLAYFHGKLDAVAIDDEVEAEGRMDIGSNLKGRCYLQDEEF